MDFNPLEMVIRTTAAFFAILFLARLIGKKQLSQLTFFHYVTGITIGSIASEISAQAETPFWDGLLSLIWWSLLTLGMSYLSLYSKKLRTLIDDRPTIIIENGQIHMHNLKKCRLNFDELGMLLREQSIFSFADVQYAILETNGELSVLKYEHAQNACKQDVKTNISQNERLPTEVVVNGKIIIENLLELELSEDWLAKKLKRKGVDSIEQVDYAQVLADGSLYISSKKI